MRHYPEFDPEADQSAQFKQLNNALEHQRQRRRGDNRRMLEKSGLRFKVTNNGECLCFREQGKPRVDFYPSTGRWRVVGGKGQAFRGGAAKFLKWYREQGAQAEAPALDASDWVWLDSWSRARAVKTS